MSVHLFGIRHHGPGCARSLRAALEALAPDLVLVEGPPDAAGVLPLASDPAMKPPVALLVYPREAPERAVFYPFAEFSPEWQALRYALERGVPVRFMDLPQSHRLAERPEAPATSEEQAPAEPPADPLSLLARAAGHVDPELWWEEQVERRRDALGLFEAIQEAMTAVRAEAPPPREEEARREAHMRTTLRVAEKEGFGRIAVVCGAWHVPALAERVPAKVDQALLRGLPKTPVEATWIPWTHSRLASRSGYGAGVYAPGWYHLLWRSPEGASVRWATEAARLLRAEDLSAPSASVIEVVRLAEALAAVRELRSPGLAELNEAVRAVLCGGDETPLRLIRERLELGTTMGEVPSSAPTVPLQRDLQEHQRRLRLKPSAEAKGLDLDLRKDTDRERSRLFHRLRILGVGWGEPREAGNKAGTFHELWEVRWRPEFEVALIEASVWGNTLQDAASARLRRDGDEATALSALTVLLDRAVLAELQPAVEHLLSRLQARAALSADVQHLMDALAPLARLARYGDVRSTPSEQVVPIIDGLFARILVGLPGGCTGIDAEAAAQRLDGMAGVQQSVDLLERADLREEWLTLLRGTLARDGVHALVRGGCARLLLEQRALGDDELAGLAGLALSPALPPLEAAAWLEGLLRGSGLLLLHQDGLWVALDRWLLGLAGETFTEMLPLVRRAFASFAPPERRAMGERVKRLGRAGGARPAREREGELRLERARADAVLPVLAHILGVES